MLRKAIGLFGVQHVCLAFGTAGCGQCDEMVNLAVAKPQAVVWCRGCLSCLHYSWLYAILCRPTGIPTAQVACLACVTAGHVHCDTLLVQCRCSCGTLDVVQFQCSFPTFLMRQVSVQSGIVMAVQMSEVVRLGGGHSDADACGPLVWAQTEGNIWWPAETLDPFHMPPGRALPAAALAGMGCNLNLEALGLSAHDCNADKYTSHCCLAAFISLTQACLVYKYV